MLKHSLYEFLQPILLLVWPFHIIIINFILTLLILKVTEFLSVKFNYILSVTDKFIKEVLLMPSKVAMRGKEWVIKLLEYLLLAN